MNTFATDVFSAGLVVYEMLSANNGPGAATFSELVDDVSQLRADAESPGVRQELNLSIDISHAAIEEPLRELLHCTLEPDPEVRCGIGGAARLAARMLAAAKLDSDRIFQAHRSKKRFCTSQHDTAHSAEKTGKAPGVQGSLPLNSAVPGVRTVRTPELRGIESLKIHDADAFLVPLIRKGRTKGTVASLESALTTGGNVSGALALRAALPLSLKAWDKYRPDLVNRSVIEIDAVRFDGDLHLVIALARQPDLMEAARKAARFKGLWVQFRIQSTPLDLLEWRT